MEWARYFRPQALAGVEALHGRAAVRSVPTAELDLVGLALRAPHNDTDAVVGGLRRHR